MLDVIKADLSQLGTFVVFLIERELRSKGLPVVTFGPLEPEKVVIGLTADRSVLGCMNEMAYASRVDIAIHGGLMRCDVAGLNRRLRRDIHSPRGYERPIDLIRRDLPALQVVSRQRDAPGHSRTLLKLPGRVSRNRSGIDRVKIDACSCL